ncbi:alpha/beta fold hydrolase [Streptomyces jumonjinensis]|uniref:Alpha/beta hydrolase n=2 Tax=Streptomyces TaxID=1883 RepID=A0A646KHI0_STRJU|nr:alpha/beta hydrolase [Streptomyces jumonjinensis]MQT01705.1 alpha/beta hydrolase [Streptomyces jumonjinensis]
MSTIEYASRSVDVPGGRIHVVEHGQGPLVVLVHGFPESWYSWRHQIPALAAAGYRVAAIDVRGYGRSVKPASLDEYGMLHLVSDVVGVITALGGGTPAVVIGHDWGATIAAQTALLRPDLVRAVGLLSVPYTPRNEHVPTEVFTALAPKGAEFYISYFQEPGRAEAEIEPDVREWLRGFYAALSAETGDMGVFMIPEGAEMRDAFPAATPAWLTDEILDRFTAELTAGAVTGGLNRYRCMDRDWALTGAWAGARILQPALYIGGDKDGPGVWLKQAIENFPSTMPRAQTHLLKDCGHWMQQEQPEQVNALLTQWLGALPQRDTE